MHKYTINNSNNQLPSHGNTMQKGNYLGNGVAVGFGEGTAAPVCLSGVKYYARSNDFSKDTAIRKDLKISSDFMCQKKVLLTVDWLSVRLHDTMTPSLFDSEGIYRMGHYMFKLSETGTAQFKHKCDVFYGFPDSKKIGVLAFGARQQTLKGSMLYKLENHLFYDNFHSEVAGFNEVLSELFSALCTTVLNVTRLDIAVDGINFDAFANDLLVHRKYEQIKVKNIVARLDNKSFDIESFTVGQRNGKKYGVYYNKSKEIEDNGFKKRYILDYYEANGFDTTKDIKRFEIRLNSEAIRDMGGFDLKDLRDNDSLAKIMEFQIKNFFQFVPSTGIKTKSRRPPVELFDFSGVDAQEYVRVPREKREGVRTVKIMVKRLVKEVYTSKEVNDHKLQTAADLVQSYDLQKWLLAKSYLWEKEFDDTVLEMGIDIPTQFPSGIYYGVSCYYQATKSYSVTPVGLLDFSVDNDGYDEALAPDQFHLKE